MCACKPAEEGEDAATEGGFGVTKLEVFPRLDQQAFEPHAAARGLGDELRDAAQLPELVPFQAMSTGSGRRRTRMKKSSLAAALTARAGGERATNASPGRRRRNPPRKERNAQRRESPRDVARRGNPRTVYILQFGNYKLI